MRLFKSGYARLRFTMDLIALPSTSLLFPSSIYGRLKMPKRLNTTEAIKCEIIKLPIIQMIDHHPGRRNRLPAFRVEFQNLQCRVI